MITTTHEYTSFNGCPLADMASGAEGWRYCHEMRACVLITATHQAEIWHGDDGTARLEITDLRAGIAVMTKDYGLGHCGAEPFEDVARFFG